MCRSACAVVLFCLLLLLRHEASLRLLLPAALTGLSLAALHGLHALARLEQGSITSVGLWDYRLALQPLVVFVLGPAVSGPVFHLVGNTLD